MLNNVKIDEILKHLQAIYSAIVVYTELRGQPPFIVSSLPMTFIPRSISQTYPDCPLHLVTPQDLDCFDMA